MLSGIRQSAVEFASTVTLFVTDDSCGRKSRRGVSLSEDRAAFSKQEDA
jgi:hypothetical protein